MRTVVSAELDSEESARLRDLASLLKEIDKKTAHMRLLLEHAQIPIMASDMPVQEWIAYRGLVHEVSALRELHMQLKNRKRRK